MAAKKKPAEITLPLAIYTELVDRATRAERERAEMLRMYHALVEKMADLATGDRKPSPPKPMKLRGGPADDEIVTDRERNAANAIVARRIKQREREDKAFLKKATADFIGQGLSLADAEREAKLLREKSRTTTMDED